MCRLIREVWLHLVVVKCCLVVQQGRNCDQFSSQMLEKLDEYAVWHILNSCNIVMHSNVPLWMCSTVHNTGHQCGSSSSTRWWSPPPVMGVRGYYPRKNLGNMCSKSCIFVQLVLYFSYNAVTDFVLNATYKFCGGNFWPTIHSIQIQTYKERQPRNKYWL